MIQARSNIVKLLETVQQQQQLFTDLYELCKEDPTIPFAFTKDNRVHIGQKMEMRIVALGLDNGGKTSILFKLKQNEFVSTITTIGLYLLILIIISIIFFLTELNIIFLQYSKKERKEFLTYFFFAQNIFPEEKKAQYQKKLHCTYL